MSAQSDHLPPLPPAPAPKAAARLLARIRTQGDGDRRQRWLQAFERDWAKALDDSRQTYDLTPLHEVVRTWQVRLDSAPAVDAFITNGMDDEDGIDFDELFGARP